MVEPQCTPELGCARLDGPNGQSQEGGQVAAGDRGGTSNAEFLGGARGEAAPPGRCQMDSPPFFLADGCRVLEAQAPDEDTPSEAQPLYVALHLHKREAKTIEARVPFLCARDFHYGMALGGKMDGCLQWVARRCSEEGWRGPSMRSP